MVRSKVIFNGEMVFVGGEGFGFVVNRLDAVAKYFHLRYCLLEALSENVTLPMGGVLLLFGGKKIPELMKGLGRGVKEFKDATNNDEKEQDGSES